MSAATCLPDATEPIEAYLGIDVGSLSTKAVVMDKQKRILAKIYLMTAGRPLDAIHQVMKAIGDQVQNKVKIIGAASTGSGRYLTGDFIGADVVINEITAQATGAAIVNPKVDTIFEIGGQDSKYISLEQRRRRGFRNESRLCRGNRLIYRRAGEPLGHKHQRRVCPTGLREQITYQIGRAMHGLYGIGPAQLSAAGGEYRRPCRGTCVIQSSPITSTALSAGAKSETISASRAALRSIRRSGRLSKKSPANRLWCRTIMKLRALLGRRRSRRNISSKLLRKQVSGHKANSRGLKIS